MWQKRGLLIFIYVCFFVTALCYVWLVQIYFNFQTAQVLSSQLTFSGFVSFDITIIGSEKSCENIQGFIYLNKKNLLFDDFPGIPCKEIFLLWFSPLTTFLFHHYFHAFFSCFTVIYTHFSLKREKDCHFFKMLLIFHIPHLRDINRSFRKSKTIFCKGGFFIPSFLEHN